MLVHGDELGRTQRGNNNAYCQDNEISWVDWANVDEPMLAFTRRVVALRHSQPVLRRQHFFQGQVGPGRRRKDIVWFKTDGVEMEEDDWAVQDRRSLGMLLNGDLIPDRDDQGEQIRGDTLLVLLHAHHEDTTWRMPTGWGERWEVLLDTALPEEAAGTRCCAAGAKLRMVARSLVVLRRTDGR
jgi:glycogen operon protein